MIKTPLTGISMAFQQTAGIVVTRYKKIFSIYSTWKTFSIRYLPWKSVLRSCWEGGSYYTILSGNAHIPGCDVLPELLDSFKWPEGENLNSQTLLVIDFIPLQDESVIPSYHQNSVSWSGLCLVSAVLSSLSRRDCWQWRTESEVLSLLRLEGGAGGPDH